MSKRDNYKLRKLVKKVTASAKKNLKGTGRVLISEKKTPDIPNLVLELNFAKSTPPNK